MNSLALVKREQELHHTVGGKLCINSHQLLSESQPAQRQN